MTLEELLGKAADEWDKLTKEELEEWSKQFYHITRPQKVISLKKEPIKISKNKTIDTAMALAKQMGLLND